MTHKQRFAHTCFILGLLWICAKLAALNVHRNITWACNASCVYPVIRPHVFKVLWAGLLQNILVFFNNYLCIFSTISFCIFFTPRAGRLIAACGLMKNRRWQHIKMNWSDNYRQIVITIILFTLKLFGHCCVLFIWKWTIFYLMNFPISNFFPSSS